MRKILSWLLHHANRKYHTSEFYFIKNKLLRKYGHPDGFDIQYIEGKKCHSCGGTGYHILYRWNGKPFDTAACYRCYGGWYKRPTYNILQRFSFGPYTFHQPIERVYFKRPDIKANMIEGFIHHNDSRYSDIAASILFLFYDSRYFKKHFSSALRDIRARIRYKARRVKMKLKPDPERQPAQVCYENFDDMPF